MEGTIIIFRVLKYTSLKRTNQFCKKFYGQNTSTHKGKYQYRRKGLLDEMPNIKLIRGVIIIPKKYTNRIIKFLQEYNAEIHARTIILTAQDRKSLSKA